MQVETYECEETATETVEMTDEARAIIEKLGLSGQEQLSASKPEDDGTTPRCPYRKITGEEDFVYRTICPTAVKLETYSESPIPLRVLQVAAHAVKFFTYLEVWHAAGVTVKDPVLIGCKQIGDHSWNVERYILARWADALDEWPAVVKTALRLFADKARAILNEQARDATMKRDSIGDIGLSEAIKLRANLGGLHFA